MLGKGNWEDNGYLKIINLEASDKLPPKGLMIEANSYEWQNDS